MKRVEKMGIGLVVASLMTVGALGRAESSNRVNTPGTACQFSSTTPGWANGGVPAWVLKRFDNGGVSNPDSVAHDVTCPMTNSFIKAAAGIASYYIDGNNGAGVTTACTVFNYNFQGTLISSSAFTTTDATFDKNGHMAYSELFDYFTVRCTLQPGHTNIIRGATIREDGV